jgi:CheY-like chemotaxis protein
VGSVFWIELIADVAPQPAAGEDEPTAVAQTQYQDGAPLHTLLYVEDNPANMKLVEQLVARHADLRLQTAVDANTGIELARTSQPDVILMDINLPGISGVEAMKILREHPATAHIPIVAISANAMPRDIEKGLEAGFFRYLTKPIKVKEFEDTLNVALAFAKEREASVPGVSEIQQIDAGETVSDADASDTLTPEVLVSLPDELIGRLQEAAMNADHDQLLLLTDEVEHYDKRKSQQLRHCMEAFDYQSLLDALQAGG